MLLVYALFSARDVLWYSGPLQHGFTYSLWQEFRMRLLSKSAALSFGYQEPFPKYHSDGLYTGSAST